MAKKFRVVELASNEQTLAMLDERSLETASSYRRIVAYIIDWGITYFVSYFLMVKTNFGRFAFYDLTSEELANYSQLFWAWAIFPLYYAICTSMIRRTIGCSISRIVVIMRTGKRLGFLYGFGRGFIMGTITALFFPVLFILHVILALVSFRTDPFKSVSWDTASGSIVVQKRKKRFGNIPDCPDN